MRRSLAVVLVCALAAAVCLAAPAPERQEKRMVGFTDSLGRVVQVPERIGKVAVSGPLAQIALFAICPDSLAGVARDWDPESRPFIARKYLDLPKLGQLYGGKGELNMESLLAAGVDVVVDVGEPKKTAKEDLDRLQAQTGIPFVHITGSLETMGQAYRKLGELLDRKDEAERLAESCERIRDLVRETLDKAGRKTRILYVVGQDGLHVIARGSYQAEVIDMVADNVAVVDHPTAKGTGNQIDLEQVLGWDPDVVVFSPESIYGEVASTPVWKDVRAIREGRFLRSPIGPYNWMGFPPSVQRYLGMLWLSKSLYPEAAPWDLYEEVRDYFALFYHHDLGREEFDALVGQGGADEADV